MLIDNDGKIVTKSDPTTELAETTSIIQTPAKNLSSKIDSILRSIENLTEKKLRIEFEIKKQKKSLLRKKEELKKVQNSNRRRLKISLEAANPNQDSIQEEFDLFQKEVSRLLEKSARVLDED
jgi:seryl-tRNA synthetase